MELTHWAHRPLVGGLRVLLLIALATFVAACGGSSSGNSDTSLTPEPVELRLNVLNQHGARLAGATVEAGNASGTSASDGSLTLTVDSATEVIVTASLEGYITQSVRIPAETDIQAQIRLMQAGQRFEVTDISEPRTLSTSALGGRLQIPGDAFVTPDGNPATGPATLVITPWDIDGPDLTAMPGDSEALDAGGERVQLISAGLMTVQVHNSDGDLLQLAPNAEATLQMDLPFDNIDEQTLQIGDEIPMWHFDEAEGLWIENDNVLGQVIASGTSPVGLAVTATVPHFSTWNWDFKFEGGAEIDVQCVLASNQTPTPCSVTATVTLAGGSVVTRSSFIPAGGVTIINMPSDATIEWYATTLNGLLGLETSALSGGSGPGVIIELQAPATDHDVQCEMPDNTIVACDITHADGANSQSQPIPAALTNIVTLWSNPGPTVNWEGELPAPLLYNGDMVLAEGTQTSGINGTVIITLDDITVVDEIAVNCVSATGTNLPCNVSADATVASGPNVLVTESIPVGGDDITLPADTTLIDWEADTNGNAFSQNGQFILFMGTATTALQPSVTLVLDTENVQGPAAQSIEVRCINGTGATAVNCDIEAYREGGPAGFVLLEEFLAVPVGDYVTLNLPNGMGEGEFLVFEVFGDDSSTAFSTEAYNGLADGQQIDHELTP